MFIGCRGRHLAHMAQSEQTTLWFDHGTQAEEDDKYIDLAAALTAANRKQYHQVSRDGSALKYIVRITATKGTTAVQTLQNSYFLSNATKMTTKGWKAQLRHAGVKLKDLPPYGRRPRFALENKAFYQNVQDAGTGEFISEISDLHLVPKTANGGNTYFVTYNSTDGKSIRYHSDMAASTTNIAANMVTQVTITDGAGTESNVSLVMSDTAGFQVIDEYFKSRRQSPDVSIDTPGPTQDSDMLNLFSIAEELSDDIIEGISEYMDWKPYTPDSATNNFSELCEAGTVSTITSATAQYPPVSYDCEVPLGLLKIPHDQSASFRVDVLSIHEM
jgi:hypothetical protein